MSLNEYNKFQNKLEKQFNEIATRYQARLQKNSENNNLEDEDDDLFYNDSINKKYKSRSRKASRNSSSSKNTGTTGTTGTLGGTTSGIPGVKLRHPTSNSKSTSKKSRALTFNSTDNVKVNVSGQKHKDINNTHGLEQNNNNKISCQPQLNLSRNSSFQQEQKLNSSNNLKINDIKHRKLYKVNVNQLQEPDTVSYTTNIHGYYNYLGNSKYSGNSSLDPNKIPNLNSASSPARYSVISRYSVNEMDSDGKIDFLGLPNNNTENNLLSLETTNVSTASTKQRSRTNTSSLLSNNDNSLPSVRHTLRTPLLGHFWLT